MRLFRKKKPPPSSAVTLEALLEEARNAIVQFDRRVFPFRAGPLVIALNRFLGHEGEYYHAEDQIGAFHSPDCRDGKCMGSIFLKWKGYYWYLGKQTLEDLQAVAARTFWEETGSGAEEPFPGFKVWRAVSGGMISAITGDPLRPIKSEEAQDNPRAIHSVYEMVNVHKKYPRLSWAELETFILEKSGFMGERLSNGRDCSKEYEKILKTTWSKMSLLA
ncbi:MAG: hypothetical protein ACE5OZ_11440 [Candidatus Heimdallarchaeota archaeon]